MIIGMAAMIIAILTASIFLIVVITTISIDGADSQLRAVLNPGWHLQLPQGPVLTWEVHIASTNHDLHLRCCVLRKPLLQGQSCNMDIHSAKQSPTVHCLL